MKGIAPIIIALLGIAAVGTGLFVSTVVSPEGGFFPSAENASSQGEPGDTGELIDIGSDAFGSVPWADLIDYAWSGTLGIVQWLGNVVSRLAGWVASAAAGKPIELPTLVGVVIVLLILLFMFYRNWNSLWGFVMNKAVLVIIFMAVIFILIVVLRVIGLV